MSKLTDFFKRKTKTVNFDKENKDEYDAKFERAKVQATTTVEGVKGEAMSLLDKLPIDELKTKLATAVGAEKDKILEVLRAKLVTAVGPEKDKILDILKKIPGSK